MLMKAFKNALPGSLLISPDVRLCELEDTNISTGQQQQVTLDLALKSKCNYLLLDEWDANLDKKSVSRYDKLLDEYAKTAVVVEVRHKS
jgi:ABC-type transport system involved in cytochrome bd biosynthesis fused ATPase/permease subunit